MNIFRRFILAFSCIGHCIAIVRVASIAWPIDPIATIIVIMAVGIVMVMLAHEALDRESAQ